MKFEDLYSDAEETTNVTGKRALIKRAIQRTLDRISGFQPWPFYLDFGWITTVDDITAGDADVTNNSRSVTSDNGSTSWPVGVADNSSRRRKFRIQDVSPYYTIASRASATSITLDQPYHGATATDQSHRIYLDEYRLFGDVDVEHTFRQIEDEALLLNADPAAFDAVYPAPDSYGDALIAVPIGRRQDIYSTGTVSATAGTTTITGSSTAWLSVQGLSRGNRIRIGTNVYTVRSVDSDTQVTTYEAIATTVSGSAYELFMDNMVVQLYQIPDEIRNYHYRYYRKPAPLVNDYDEPDLPPAYHWLLLRGALIEAWSHKGDESRSQRAEQELIRGMQQMRVHYTSDRLYERRPSIIGQMRRSRLLYPPNYDWRGSR